MSLLKKVALIIDMTTGDGGTYEDSFLNLIYKLDLPKTYSEDEPEIFEDLDFENFCFSKVEDDEIVFCAGGDWQTPLTITIKLNEFDDIYVANYKDGYEEDEQIRFHDIIEKVITNSSGGETGKNAKDLTV